MIDFSLIDIIALGFVVFVGLPHGAFDGAVYLQLPQYKRPSDFIAFLILYVAIALAVVGIWYLLPLLSLLLFLALSAFHFGTGDAPALKGGQRVASIISHGGLATIYLPLIHQDEAFTFFALLTFQDKDALAPLEMAYYGLGSLWAVSLIFYGIKAISTRSLRRPILEIVGAAMIMAYLPLLAGFAFYFCAIHSARHFTAVYQSLKHASPSHLWGLTAGLTMASWIAGAALYFWLAPYQGFVVSVIQIIFIGLAALTVPHMILIDGVWRPVLRLSKR